MTKEKLLMILIGTYLGLCIGTFVGLTQCPKEHVKECGWTEYRLVVDQDDEINLPYNVYDANGDSIGVITADALDKIIK
jgi:hypothetical protein